MLQTLTSFVADVVRRVALPVALVILAIPGTAHARKITVPCGQARDIDRLQPPRALVFSLTNEGDCTAHVQAFDGENQSGNVILDEFLVPGESAVVHRLRPLARSLRIDASGGEESAIIDFRPISPATLPNILGNAGFEVWSLGSINAGPLPPNGWYPMGATMGLFDQDVIKYTQVDASAAAGFSGSYAVQISEAHLGSGAFVAQSLENFKEYRGKRVTMSIDLAWIIDSRPRIEISDGRSTSSTSVLLPPGSCSRLTVTHVVASDATELQFRIYPDVAIQADNAQAVLADVTEAAYAPRKNPEPALEVLALGSVIDWWRFAESVRVPERYWVCDGSVISDPESPFHGLRTPDLRDRFVLGKSSVDQIGETGGSFFVDLTHDHSIGHVHSGRTGGPSGPDELVHRDPMPPPFDDVANGSHTHSFVTDGPSQERSGLGLGVTEVRPPYVGLLKIVRIK